MSAMLLVTLGRSGGGDAASNRVGRVGWGGWIGTIMGYGRR